MELVWIDARSARPRSDAATATAARTSHPPRARPHPAASGVHGQATEGDVAGVAVPGAVAGERVVHES